MSHVSLILTLSGRDRSGLVEELARAIAENGGNWEQSRMVHLADQFVGLLEVLVPEEKADALSMALRNLPDLFLTINMDRPAPSDAKTAFSLELLGSDQPGIVQKISRILAEGGANIEELHTSTEAAADSGGLLFRARMRLSGATSAEVESIRARLEELGNDLTVEIAVQGP